METVLLLIKIITLFYQESIVGTDSDDSSEFVDELLDNIPTPVEGTGDDFNRGRNVIQELINELTAVIAVSANNGLLIK